VSPLSATVLLVPDAARKNTEVCSITRRVQVGGW
jgi:hypothetical protein